MHDHKNEDTSSLLNFKGPTAIKDKQINSTLYLKETSAIVFNLHEEHTRLYYIFSDEKNIY